MKKITIMIFIIVATFLMNCQPQQVITLEEPIRIYIEDDIPKTGIKIWDKQIIWVGSNEKPDVKILKTNYLPKNYYAMETHRFTRFGRLIKPVYIHVRKINDIVIAHEFAHLLGRVDSCEDEKSIMCSSYTAIYRSFEWFTEFKKDK